MEEGRVAEHLPVMQIPKSVTIIMMICRWRWCEDRSKCATMHIKYVETFIFCIIIAEMCVKLCLNSNFNWLIIVILCLKIICTSLCFVGVLIFAEIFRWYMRSFAIEFVIWELHLYLFSNLRLVYDNCFDMFSSILCTRVNWQTIFKKFPSLLCAAEQ